MTSNNFKRVPHGHHDLILATNYNLYGNRRVTASSDHRLRVWDRDDKSEQWTVTDTWTAHAAEITDVRWNGPYIGEHLASISEDGYLRIWQEDVSQGLNSGRRFRKIFEQVTATGVPYMGLDFKNIGSETYLAVITRDGYLTVQEPEDHDELSAWQILWSDYLCNPPSRTQETGFRLSWHKEKVPAWPALLAGLDRKSLGLVVSIGEVARVFRTDQERKFYTAVTLEGAKDLIRDVHWAGGSVRGFDLIATACKDGFVRLYELHTPGAAALPKSSRMRTSTQNGDNALSPAPSQTRSGIGAGLAGGANGRRDDHANAPGAIKQEARLAAELKTHGAPWRISMSPEADLLLTTGDDGMVRIWKKAVDGKWLEGAEIDGTR